MESKSEANEILRNIISQNSLHAMFIVFALYKIHACYFTLEDDKLQVFGIGNKHLVVARNEE